MVGVPAVTTVAAGPACGEGPVLLPRVAATTPPAAAPPAIPNRMAMVLPEIPPAAAPVAKAFDWLMVALAVWPWCEAVTWIW